MLWKIDLRTEATLFAPPSVFSWNDEVDCIPAFVLFKAWLTKILLEPTPKLDVAYLFLEGSVSVIILLISLNLLLDDYSILSNSLRKRASYFSLSPAEILFSPSNSASYFFNRIFSFSNSIF